MNDIVDMSQYVEAKSDQLNADDLIGSPRTITVRKVTGSDGDQPVSIYYEGDNNKPFKPCKSIRRVLLAVWGRHAADYVGRSMTIYRDDKVTFGGLEVGGIRISHMSHIDKETTVVVLKSKGKKAAMKVAPLQVDQKPDKAAEGAGALLQAIHEADDLDAMLADPKVKQQRDWLSKNRPELSEMVETRITLGLASRSGDPFDAETGSDTGEGFNDDPDVNDSAPSLSDEKLASIRKQIAAAQNQRGLQAVDREWEKARGAYDDETAAEVDGLIRARRKELG